MASSRSTIRRRTLLGAAAVLPLAAACTSAPPPGPPSGPESALATTTPASFSVAPTEVHHEQLAALEGKFDAVLGVYAVATGSGSIVAHRADERFAFCSTFKGLAAAAVLQRNPDLAQLVRYTEDDLFAETSFITREHVATGMSLRELCEAAVCHSDGTAGNLLLRNIGGPQQLMAYVRDLGDTVTRMDRFEPDLTEATPGDLRDTTTPRALGTDYSKIVLGDVLPADRREILRDLLKDNRTKPGPLRVRAGVPQGWTVADKTGTGSYGTVNDVAVVWPPASAPPLVVSIMSRKTTRDVGRHDALIAEATAYAVSVLT